MGKRWMRGAMSVRRRRRNRWSYRLPASAIASSAYGRKVDSTIRTDVRLTGAAREFYDDAVVGGSLDNLRR